jgi:hypothetical protein
MRKGSKQLEEAQPRILNLVRAGNHPAIAATSVGVPRGTYYRWEQLGRDGRKPYAEFVKAVAQAQAESEAREVVTVQRASVVDKHPVTCPQCGTEYQADFLQMLASAGLTERAQRIKSACAQNSLSLLSLRFPKRWSPRVIHTIEDEHNRLLDVAQRLLAPEAFESLLEGYLAETDGEDEARVYTGNEGPEPVH